MKKVFDDVSIIIIDIDSEMKLYSSGIDVMEFFENENGQEGAN